MCSIEEVPDEVLEFILCQVSHYKDLHSCLSVNRRWRRCVLNVVKIKERNIRKAINDLSISWETLAPINSAPTITKRYSHSAVIHDDSMYVFGGCAAGFTTFNDLWRFDLTLREWVRHLTMGSYPSPKACCSLICHNNLLVLFGGWTHPPSFPLHQTLHLFNELHVYDVATNHWTCINSELSPPPTAGHSVSVHGNWMVIFGGLQKGDHVVHSIKTNEIWRLNLDTWIWHKQETANEVKPIARYAHSQIEVDSENLLIMGGTGGTGIFYSDIWLLKMTGSLWKWVQVELRNTSDGPPHLWSTPACKIGDKVVFLSRGRQNNTPPVMYYSKKSWLPQNHNENRRNEKTKQIDVDENVNGKRGTFNNVKRQNDEPTPGPSNSRSNHFRDKLVTNNQPSGRGLNLSAFNGEVSVQDNKRERRLNNLKRIEEKFKNQLKHKAEIKEISSPKKRKKSVLGLYVLDISHVLEDKPYATWMPLNNNGVFTEGPEETLFYSLVAGKAELIMFGGLKKDGDVTISCNNDNMNRIVTNLVHFVTAPKYII